ncbi:MAG TPA: anhydro-N-acetylmuramic acid kinase, partial [Micromonosporaceae bacterium]
IANLTVPARGLAFDTGPGNALIDAAVVAATGGTSRMDLDGAAARRGTVDDELLDGLLADPYYRQPAPKSTGKELFHAGYLQRFPLPARSDDLIATLTALTAATIADACRAYRIDDLVVSGGGTENPALMSRLRGCLPGVAVRRVDDVGLASGDKEAYAFGVLGFLTMHGLPGVRTTFTGAGRAAILGSITPGASPLRLPEPVAKMPTTLTLLR